MHDAAIFSLQVILVAGFLAAILVGLKLPRLLGNVPAIMEERRMRRTQRRLDRMAEKGRRISERSLGYHGAAEMDRDTAIGVYRASKSVRLLGGVGQSAA